MKKLCHLKCQYIPEYCPLPCNRGEKGSALIVVLWISVIMAGLALSGAYLAKLGLRRANYSLNEIQALYIAQAGISFAQANLYTDNNNFDSLNEKWSSDPDRYDNAVIGNGFLSVTVWDEGGKLNLNSVSAPVLQRLKPVYMANNTSEILNSLNDWKDADSALSSGGAEESYYRTLEKSYHCKNGALDSIEELYLIKGLINSEYAREICGFCTVYSAGGVNINTAPLEVLEAIPGLDQRTALSIIAHRAGRDSIEGTPDDEPYISTGEVASLAGEDVYKAIRGYITVNSKFFKIRSTGKAGKTVKSVEAMLERVGGVCRIVYWREL